MKKGNGFSSRRGLFNDSALDVDNAIIDNLIVPQNLNLADDWIYTALIQNEAITNDKILEVNADKIVGNIDVGNSIADNSIVWDKIMN